MKVERSDWNVSLFFVVEMGECYSGKLLRWMGKDCMMWSQGLRVEVR